MRKQRAADISDIALPRRAQSRMVQSAGRSSKSASHLLLHQKLLPPGPPPRSAIGNNGNAKTSQFCISSSSMGIRKLPSRVFLISKGRFGKRPPSFTTEYIGPAIDSEDSGFGCDFHSSESQPSWCTTDDSTNKSSSVQQPIFSLSSRTLSSSNLSISSQISTSSSASSSPTSVTSFTVPQFSTSSPEKQFLTNLLHESLAHEDAIDQFDGPYYTIATSAGVPTSASTSPSLSDPLPVSTSTSSSSSPQRIAQESINQAGKVLLIVPGTTSNNSQPLDFTQVFGKLSPTEIVNNTLLSHYLNGSAGAISNISTQQKKQEQQQQQFGYDSTVIKIEQELNTNSNMKLPPELINNEESSSFRVVNPTSNNDNFSKPLSPPIVNNSNIVSPIQSNCSLNTLKDILIESSREAAELDESIRENERKQNSSEGDQAVAASEVARYDPMVILSQAVTLQKELYEEPALDGIPINGKRANISGFGFAKGINTTANTNSSLNGLIVDSLPTSSLPASTLVSVVPQQTQQVLDSQQPLKLMQLTENVRMSPDSTQAGVTVSSSTLPFSSHQVTRQITTSAPVITQMGTNPTSPTSTTSNPSPSPIPVKRSRFSFAHPAASKGAGLKLRNQNQNQNYMPPRSVGKRLPPGTTPTLTSNLAPYTRDGRSQLQIVSQPEEQHRARYQTEGSRGAIKDRKGNGFPTVKLVGYDKPATLQIFIGSDQGKISPHMFYQACKVTGKSSTPCIEKKVEGTILIEIEFEPSKEMVISCDCVGILKERNVDVEQRFPFHHASQSRKKSTKCRMIYRTTVINSDGMEETLQVASLPILCTQPPGVPEICKQSLTECPARGGLELFVIGKNFLKDTRVVFQQEDTEGNAVWETSSEPLKDYLQQNHLICPVPAFKEEKIVEPVECKVLVVSGGKHSEPHRFTYLPELVNAHIGVPPALSNCISNSQNQQQASPVIQAALVQQIQNASGLLPVDMQAVSTLMPTSEGGLVKSVIVSSPNEGCSPISITSSDSSMCSPGSLEVQNFSQPSTPVTTTAMNPLSTLGFPSVPLLQTAPPPENPAVSTFQSVLQQAVAQQQQQNQQAENQAVSNFQTVLQQAVVAQQQQQNQQAESQAVSNFQSVLQQAVAQQQQQNQQAESPAVTTFQSVLQQAVVAQQQQQQQNQQAENPAVSTFQSVLQQAVVAQQQQQNQQAESPSVTTFQSVLQQAVAQQQQNQQAESKAVAVAALMKNASDLLESMKPPTTTAFSGMGLPEQKPVVTNSIPLDLQFPTQDLPAVTTTPQVQMNTTSTGPTTQLSTFAVPETVPITTINNPFQQNQQQMSCVTMPQIMNGVSGIGISGSMPSTTTAPTVLDSAVQPNPQSPPRTTMNEVVMASVNPAASVSVSTLSVAECMGQTIIKTEPTATINNDLRLTLSGNNVVSVAVASSHPPNPQQAGVMGMMGAMGELQPHQGSLANALSQMSDNELINYINPNCFEGPLP